MIFYLKIELRYIEQNVKHQYSQIYRHMDGIRIFFEIIIFKEHKHPKVKVFCNEVLNFTGPQPYGWWQCIPQIYIVEQHVTCCTVYRILFL